MDPDWLFHSWFGMSSRLLSAQHLNYNTLRFLTTSVRFSIDMLNSNLIRIPAVNKYNLLGTFYKWLPKIMLALTTKISTNSRQVTYLQPLTQYSWLYGIDKSKGRYLWNRNVNSIQELLWTSLLVVLLVYWGKFTLKE